jgi:hypothetical protein
MTTEQLAFVQGWDDTCAALRRWRARPAAVLGPWALGAFGVALALLVTTGVVASVVTGDPDNAGFPGVTRAATTGDLIFVLERNGVVLALHALACVAGFMAGSSMPLVAQDHQGLWRKVHEKAGPAAIAFEGAATLFSLATQAYTLGGQASTLARMGGISPLLLLVGMLPHALPELFGLFLPLAAWTIASRRGRWEDLLAATFVTVAIAVPLVVGAAALETWVSPQFLLWIRG